jgi:pyruvate formate-lyase/glycerol dehydratase family glycyl radical enzyme
MISPSPTTHRVETIKERLRQTTPQICSDRARLITAAYKETENEYMVMRRAKALDKILREMTIYISPDEPIVGNLASAPLAAPLFPEVWADWIEQDLDTFPTRDQDPFDVSDKVRKELSEALPYWKGRSMSEVFFQRLPEDIYDAMKTKVIRIKEGGGIGHQLINAPIVLDTGLIGIKDRIHTQIKKIDLAQPGAYRKYTFYQALLLTCGAVIEYAHRYAREARRLASSATDSDEIERLQRIAETCERVPLHPAQTFYDALQVVSFLTMIAHVDQSGTGITIGRLDQFLFPFYQRDLANGQLTQDEAQELLDCLWLKLQDPNICRSNEAVPIWPGYELNLAITIGGQTEDGQDATNDLTYMCLESEARIHMRQPQLIMRVHENTPDDLWMKAVEVIRLGGGKPSLVSDRINMEALLRLGVPKEEVLGYSVIGCAEPVVTGGRILLRWSFVSLAKVLELTLYDGVDPRTGVRVGLSTGHAKSFSSYDDFYAAFQQQLSHFVSYCAVVVNGVADPLVSEQMPHPFFSITTPDCIEKGLDISEGGARYDWTVVWPIGLATAGNSLAAIKKFVFEEKKISMEDLLDALEANFEGHVRVQRMLLNSPKFGNDDDYADPITATVAEDFYDYVETYRTARGGKFTSGYITVGINVSYGRFVAATPDGRRAGEPLSDGMSPAQGTEVQGPTASFKSVGKLELYRAGSGGILNEKYNPSVLTKESDVQKFIELNRVFMNNLGGMQVQYNVVSADTLRDAQAHPEKYPDLLVRVVGYSAYFTELSRQVQDDIIARSEFQAL